tara:strand:- start:2071 stop:2514 length:444 start_codon:yes stop_codon:yes gene_type:complete
MKLISHRGNIRGRQPDLENSPEYIKDAISKGYDVEIDIWWYNKNFYLGHDNPTYKIYSEFLQQPSLWCHAKNLEAIVEMKKFNNWYLKPIHYFWHQSDDITLTSQGYIWAHPGKQPIKDSIAVLPELYNDSFDTCQGICSDYIENYK